jgi:hypothetical protein
MAKRGAAEMDNVEEAEQEGGAPPMSLMCQATLAALPQMTREDLNVLFKEVHGECDAREKRDYAKVEEEWKRLVSEGLIYTEYALWEPISIRAAWTRIEVTCANGMGIDIHANSVSIGRVKWGERQAAGDVPEDAVFGHVSYNVTETGELVFNQEADVAIGVDPLNPNFGDFAYYIELARLLHPILSPLIRKPERLPVDAGVINVVAAAPVENNLYQRLVE